MLQYVTVCHSVFGSKLCSVLQCAAVCSSVLQCVAVDHQERGIHGCLRVLAERKRLSLSLVGINQAHHCRTRLGELFQLTLRLLRRVYMCMCASEGIYAEDKGGEEGG